MLNKNAIFVLIANIVVFMFQIDDVAADRGRVHVVNNVVLTDRNTVLRGATMCISCGATDAVYTKAVRNLGINVIRLGVKTKAIGRTIEQQLPGIDKAVNLASQNSMYVMINNSVDPGHYDLPSLTAFWRAVAGRYKDRTNVFYEMTSEPVPWFPKDYTTQNIADLKSVHNIMRSLAPNTHIVLFTFANLDNGPMAVSKIATMQGVDYTKASVGFHHYKTNEAAITYTKAYYPLLMTETNYWIADAASRLTTVNTLRLYEKLKIGWFSLDGKGSAIHLQNEIIPNLHAGGYYWAVEN